MTDWPIKTLGEICELISRGRPPSYCEEGGALVLNQKCIRNGQVNFGPARRTDAMQKPIPDWAYLRIGDTLVNSTGAGTLGRASFVRELIEPTTFDTHLTVVRPMVDVCWPAYVGLVLNCKEQDIVNLAGGATGQTELPREAVRAIEIPVPPLNEQKRIVALLDAATAHLIELTACYELARTHASNLFASALKKVLEDESDWPIRTLNALATIATGKIDVNAANEDGAFPFFTCSRDVYKIDDAPYQGKAILVAGNGDLNVKYYEGRFNAYQRTYILFSRDEAECFPRYIYWFLENHLDVLRSGASGSTIKYIRLGDLADASVALPPLDQQKRIVSRLDSMRAKTFEMVAAYDAKLTAAKNLRQSILETAFMGAI